MIARTGAPAALRSERKRMVIAKQARRRHDEDQVSAILRSSSDDERIAVAGMDPNFQELAREIIQEVEARVKTHLDQFETRAEKRMQMHFETMEGRMQMHFENTEERMQMHFESMEGTVRLAAEGYGATLAGIDRKLAALNEKFDKKFGDHDLVLADHNKRISKLEERA